jgi:hypothetical protein
LLDDVPAVEEMEIIPAFPHVSELLPAHFIEQSESARSWPPPEDVSIELPQ